MAKKVRINDNNNHQDCKNNNIAAIRSAHSFGSQTSGQKSDYTRIESLALL